MGWFSLKYCAAIKLGYAGKNTVQNCTKRLEGNRKMVSASTQNRKSATPQKQLRLAQNVPQKMHTVNKTPKYNPGGGF